MRKVLLAVSVLALCAGCDGRPPGPKTQQAIGAGMVGVGAAVAPGNPPVGIGIAAAGAAITAHGAYREESREDK